MGYPLTGMGTTDGSLKEYSYRLKRNNHTALQLLSARLAIIIQPSYMLFHGGHAAAKSKREPRAPNRVKLRLRNVRISLALRFCTLAPFQFSI